jgi:2-succinyl-6-hydroxy-2,4-cyclohexadiene-1-carboxylate synthase
LTDQEDHLDIEVADGLRLHVVRSGQGAPVVLLHGFTNSVETWEPLRASLDDHFNSLAVDLPGHGRSGSPVHPTRFSLRSFADDLALILDRIGVGRVAVVGYSMGGRAALQFVLRHPDRVAALVLESTSPGIADPAARAARSASDMKLADSIERDGIANFVAGWEGLPLWDSQAALPDAARQALRRQRLANDPAGLANSLRGAGAGAEPELTGRLAERLSARSVPALLIAGSLDPKYVALGRAMEARLPNTRLAVVDGAGHAVHLERPGQFAELVARFLGDVVLAPGQWR